MLYQFGRRIRLRRNLDAQCAGAFSEEAVKLAYLLSEYSSGIAKLALNWQDYKIGDLEPLV